LLAHGGRDQFVSHGHMGLLGARLRAIGVPCETIFISYAQHAFDFVVGGLSSQIFEAALLDFWPLAHHRYVTVIPSDFMTARSGV
jgi:acetyl esterase/lipase